MNTINKSNEDGPIISIEGNLNSHPETLSQLLGSLSNETNSINPKRHIFNPSKITNDQFQITQIIFVINQP